MLLGCNINPDCLRRSAYGTSRYESAATRTLRSTATIPTRLSPEPILRCSAKHPRPSAVSGVPVPAPSANPPIPNPSPSNGLPSTASYPTSNSPPPQTHSAKKALRGNKGRGPQARGSPSSAAAAAARAAADALFLDPGHEPLQAPRYGPVQIAELGGDRGWALVTRRTVHPGELLLAVRPLALAWDEPNEPQSTSRACSTNESTAAGALAGTLTSQAVTVNSTDAKFLALQRQLLNRRYTPQESAWLASLGGLPPHPTTPGEGGQGGGGQEPSRPAPPSLEEGVAGEEGEQSLPLPSRLMNLDTLADVVQANYQQLDGAAEDEEVYWARREAAAEGAEEEGVDAGPRLGPMGLWPEAAMLNHSCIPNTVSYIVGDTLFVRAARKVGAGSELTTSYLPLGGMGTGVDNTAEGRWEGAEVEQEVEEEGGPPAAPAAPAAAGGAHEEGEGTLLSPVSVRRGALEAARGFWCECSRCVAEEQLDPQLQQLMMDVWNGVQGLREDLEYAQMLAAEDDEDEEEEEEGEAEAMGQRGSRGGQQKAGAVGGGGERGDEASDDDDEEEVSRWRQLMKRVEDQALLYTGLMDAAFTKLKLTTQQQLTAQCAIAPLYMSLWTATSARGYLEPQLAEVLGVLVGEVAPGSTEHLWWTAVARDTVEMIVAEEEEAEGAPTAAATGGGFGGGGRGFARPPDPRMAAADKDCSRAYSIRYGPISRSVYDRLMGARRRRQDEQTML